MQRLACALVIRAFDDYHSRQDSRGDDGVGQSLDPHDAIEPTPGGGPEGAAGGHEPTEPSEPGDPSGRAPSL